MYLCGEQYVHLSRIYIHYLCIIKNYSLFIIILQQLYQPPSAPYQNTVGSETVNPSSSILSTSTTETTAPVNPTTFAVAVLAALGGFILLFIFLTIFVIRIRKRSKTTKTSIETKANKAYGVFSYSCPSGSNNAPTGQQTVTKASIETNTNKAYGLLPDLCPRNANNQPLNARNETFELLSIVSDPNDDITSSQQPEYDYIINHDLEPI